MKQTIWRWFTLIELIVAMSIFSIIMVSVLSVFIFSSQMSTRVELNRVMQENIKNVLEDIAEGVRKDGIIGVRNFSETCTTFKNAGAVVDSKTALCLQGAEYMIGFKNGANFEVVSNVASYCSNPDNVCYIIKKEAAGGFYPLTNSFVTFEDIRFTLSNTELPKLTIHLTARPSIRKWLSLDLIQGTRIFIQTSLSERLIETK